MDFINSIKNSIEYIETHLMEPINAKEMAERVSEQVYMSTFVFQKRFKLVTGYSFGEYLKNRRLYEAACDLSSSDIKIIELAVKYGYDSAESFSKAFKRFHGITPSMARKIHNPVKQFLPLEINFYIQGGLQMDYRFESMDDFTLVGFEKEFRFPSSYDEIPEFCNEIRVKYFNNYSNDSELLNEIKQAIRDNNIGEYAAVIHDVKTKSFKYLYGGMYKGGIVPTGMTLHTFKSEDWLKFKCIGPNPYAIQRLNTQVFFQWLPRNTEYKASGAYNIEWYGEGNSKSSAYESAIWVPVKKK